MDRLYPALIQDTGLNTEGLSRDPAVGTAYRADPLVHSNMSARLYTSIDTAGSWALAHASEFTLPLLLMHGGDDSITSAPASREFAGRAPNCTFKQWEGLRHEIHNEPEQAEVFATTIAWLNGHMK
jgi:alpha-beta hydrolase superfamily lysophospholipase